MICSNIVSKLAVLIVLVLALVVLVFISIVYGVTSKPVVAKVKKDDSKSESKN